MNSFAISRIVDQMMNQRKNGHIRLRIRVTGTVQGVGFRPFVYQLAHRLGVGGWVCNTGGGVLIEAEGDEQVVRQFADSIRSEAPSLARVSDLQSVPIAPTGSEGFEIIASLQGGEIQPIVPPDVAVCPECTSDFLSPANRRYRYPFTNCTNCGPRFTIIERVPYDRPNTTMKDFVMCRECRSEYENPMDRRFHAQPNACPVCGPHLSLDGQALGDSEVISRAASLLREGKVLAIKGLGGFHLACDARNSEAVETLRTRKGRGGKPLALMCADMDEVRRICEVDLASEAMLLSPEKPILLMPALPDNGISPLIAPGIKTLGVMLPYTPLHQLLLGESPPSLVMTSGNLSEEPIAHKDDEAAKRLGHIPDHMLTHNRPIHMACDDSVARVFGGVPMIIRRARGYVPHPIELDMDMPQILACGGDLKSTFCLTKGRLALLSQHLGDLDNAPTMEHYRNTVDHFCRFFAVEPEIIAHDLHPDYHSTRFALTLDGPKIAVQHHHAHIASCMAENHLAGPVIGVALDGTGYGTDGRIWGGEFLIADYSDFRRAAHLAYVPLPGGDAAVRRPGRMALSYLVHSSLITHHSSLLPKEEAYAVKVQIERGLNAPLTSSMGRLFDAVSALLGICSEVTYEGQAAIELEARADGPTDRTYDFDMLEDQIDVRPMIRQIVEETRRGTPVGEISSTFHSTIAEMVARVCRSIRDETGLNQVALSGGVFQNVLLLGMTLERLKASGFQVFRHSAVPTNDGGISLGQAAVAAGRYTR